jgi:hypothetical protein
MSIRITGGLRFVTFKNDESAPASVRPGVMMNRTLASDGHV